MDVPYHLLTSVGVYYPPSTAQDATFAPVITWPTGLDTDIPCRVTSKGSDYVVADNRLEGEVTHLIQMPSLKGDGTAYSVVKNSRLVVGGVTYQVLGPARDSSAMSCLLRLECEVKS